MSTSTKKRFGQFFTTRSSYILQGIRIPEDIKDCVEPFAGNGDLLDFIRSHPGTNVVYYDVDPRIRGTIKRDTLLNPPDYKNKFVVTNPPYLARNRAKDKTLYDLYGVNDLYKCFIMSLVQSDGCLGGIMIIPLNFLSSIRKADSELRRMFLRLYTIQRVNIFEERVFDDTSYTVCAIMFTKRKDKDKDSFLAMIYPTIKQLSLSLNDANNYTIGGELYTLRGTRYAVNRATSKTDNRFLSNILLKCIDDSKDKLLGLRMVSDDVAKKYIDTTPNLTGRSYATLLINPPLSVKDQEVLVVKFNKFIETNRERYNSLFLSQYRDSNTIARKRISFIMAFDIVSYLLS